MDAPEEDLDIKLQKISADLIDEFDRSLGPFLRKPDSAGGSRVRSRVRFRETARLTSSLLDPFQELPQLLDPRLPRWISLLAEAYLEYLQRHRRSKALSTRSQLLMPLPTAICKILYTLCKVRGEKVIVRFLNVEAKYLEVLLSALEDSERRTEAVPSSVAWQWEERYISLLWLSNLLLAPFDLSTISSVDADDLDIPDISGLKWPANVPGIVVRLLPLAIQYISSPGKERDAAKALLVRLAMRRDMQALGLLDSLVQWSLFSIREATGNSAQTPYHYIGVLSFLAGALASASDTSDMDRYLSTIFYATHDMAINEDSAVASVLSTALARKTMIKVIRSVAIQVLRRTESDTTGTELVEQTIGFLLESLADNDTPVRFAASKALSMITLKLDPEMASQVIEAVLESLNRNVLWVKNPKNPAAPPTRDLTSVDALEWHGLMLTLSHLLYRRSPPADHLSDILHALLMGLSFERRNAAGGSVGTNVRDAACFGIWAVARRYSTAELLAVPHKWMLPGSRSPESSRVSMLQVIGTELAVTASLDPAGNIRRGSSAALQELIGRHPDTVEKGIWVVQTVDYHAVALRSRAMLEVSLSVTKLSGQYGEAILEALLGWRGIADADAAARRVAAAAFGAITSELTKSGGMSGMARLESSVVMLLDRTRSLQVRQVEERHGLLLSLAAVLDLFPSLVQEGLSDQELDATRRVVTESLRGLREILKDSSTTTYRRPELVAEATSRFVISSFPIFLAESLLAVGEADWEDARSSLISGPLLVSGAQDVFLKTVSSSDARQGSIKPSLKELVELIRVNIEDCLNRPDQDAVTAASEAALVVLVLEDADQRHQIIKKWSETVRRRPTSRAGSGHGYFFALAMAQRIVTILGWAAAEGNLINHAVLERWNNDKDVKTRVVILKSLSHGNALQHDSLVYLPIIAEALEDYTTNARGDVGSHVRLQAIRLTRSLWKTMDMSKAVDSKSAMLIPQLFLHILRLAAEKLDKVRVDAQATLVVMLKAIYASKLGVSTFSSKEHFGFLLDLLTGDFLHEPVSAIAKSNQERWMEELMAGYVTSADTGNEDLVIASRAALGTYCDASPANLEQVSTALLRNLKNRQGQDRVVVPTLEIIAFLFSVGLFPRSNGVDYRGLCLQVQKAGYKTGNVRKLEACVKVYGAVAAMDGGVVSGSDPQKKHEGIAEARKRLGGLLLHPWPRIRSVVVDELWGLLVSVGEDDRAGKLKGADWGRADKSAIKTLVGEIGFA